MMRTLPFVVCALLVAACPGPSANVLTAVDAGSDPPPAPPMPPAPPATEPMVFDNCADVLESGFEGAACRGLANGCASFDGCIRNLYACVDGVLLFSSEDHCPDCRDDTECELGYLCIDQHCTSCPDTVSCAPCADNLTNLFRHGCMTCECGPSSACDDPNACGDGFTCALGSVCASDCNRLDCCANVCTEPGCPEPVPLGCSIACDIEACGGRCIAEYCDCDIGSGTWRCEGRCDDGTATCSAD